MSAIVPSRSRGIQRQHIREYSSGARAIINRGVKTRDVRARPAVVKRKGYVVRKEATPPKKVITVMPLKDREKELHDRNRLFLQFIVDEWWPKAGYVIYVKHIGEPKIIAARPNRQSGVMQWICPICRQGVFQEKFPAPRGEGLDIVTTIACHKCWKQFLKDNGFMVVNRDTGDVKVLGEQEMAKTLPDLFAKGMKNRYVVLNAKRWNQV